MITLAGSVPLFGSLGGKQLTAMTFARTGTAWDDAGVSYAANTPRYGGPIPEPTTNLALRSEALSTSPWGGTGYTITPALSPVGDMTANRLQSSLVSGNVVQAVTVTPSTTYTFSFYAKNNGGTVARYRVYNNTSAAEIVAPTSYLASINGESYTRISVTFTTPAGCTSIGIYAANHASLTVDVLVWGVQLEQKDHATPYTGATTGAPRTRGILATEPTTNLLTANASNAGTDLVGIAKFRSNETLTRDTAVIGAGGVASVKVDTPGLLVNEGLVVGSGITGTTGQTFTCSCWIKGTGLFWVTLADGIANVTTQVVLTGDWQRVSISKTLTAGATIAMRVTTGDTRVATFWVDGRQIEQTAWATDWLLGGTSRAGVPYHNGVIVEEVTTNLVTQSAALNDAFWTLTNATVTANAIVAPDGTVTADKLCEDASVTVPHNIARATLLTAASAGAWSFYAKAAERSWIVGNAGSKNAYFDLVNGVLGTVDAGVTATITPVGGGWFRCTMSQASMADGTCRIYLATGNGVVTYTGTAGNGAYVWGVQAEVKAYPTGYVPTAGATATRNGDNLTIDPAGLLRPDQGTIVMRYYADGDNISATPGKQRDYFGMNAGGAVDRIELRRTVAGTFQAIVGNSGGTNTASVTNTPTVGWHNLAMVYGAAKLSLFLDGVQIANTNNPTFLPAALRPSFSIGNDPLSAASQLNSPIAWVAFYDRTLTTGELAGATNGNLPPNYTAFYDFSKPTLAGVGHIRNMVYDDQQFGSIGLAPNSIG